MSESVGRVSNALEPSSHGGQAIYLGVPTDTERQLAVRFEWSQDRYRHWVVIRGRTAGHPAHEDVLLATSIDSQSDSPWPASPPIQQLDQCRIGADRHGLVGLGMAGTSHWSLAVEVGEQGIWFDVACRLQMGSGSPHSCYQTPGGRPIERPAGNGVTSIRWPDRDDQSIIDLRVAESTQLETDRRAEGWAIRLRPRDEATSFPVTLRWQYGFYVT